MDRLRVTLFRRRRQVTIDSRERLSPIRPPRAAKVSVPMVLVRKGSGCLSPSIILPWEPVPTVWGPGRPHRVPVPAIRREAKIKQQKRVRTAR